MVTEFRHCSVEVLTREELARHELPHPSKLTLRQLYRIVFHSESSFTAAVEALEARGRLPKRANGTYRVWDAYRILDEVGRCARIVLPGTPRIRTGVVGFPSLHLLDALNEDWWERVEAARVGLELVWRERYLQFVQDFPTGGRRRETVEEGERRLKALHEVVTQEIQALSAELSPEEKFWRDRLTMHARLVIHLRGGNFDSLARLCAGQLSTAVLLGELRLGRSRSDLRKLVGVVEGDLTAPALTAASFSVETKAFDAALDYIEKALPDYNNAMPAPLRLTPEEPHRFLQFLAQQWPTAVVYGAHRDHVAAFDVLRPDQ